MVDELIGKVIGGYEIISRIGEGGMATVYLAKQQSMNDRQVALKVLPQHFVKDDTYMERFKREVKIVSQLEHRNIVPVYDYGEYDGQPYIVMRYMPSGSLDDILQRGPMPTDAIDNIVSQIAPALDFGHSKGVLHRDLKPSNVLIDEDGGAFLTDFGIARVVGDNNPGLTTQGVVGTPSYMSPEQAQGKELDGRSDVYSLGVMLFEMATGRRPFENDTPYSIAVMQVTTPPPMPRQLNPTISTALEAVILKALKKSRDNRYQTAVALAESLRQAIERPTTVHDTEPRLKMTSYAEIVSREAQPSQPSLAANPAHYPPSPSSASRPIVPPPSSLRSQIRNRRAQSPLFSALIGSSIGCGLLGIIIAAAFLTFNFLLPDKATRTPDTTTRPLQTAATTDDTANPRPSLDPTNQAASSTLIARATRASNRTITPLAITASPGTSLGSIPVEGTPQLLNGLQAVSGTLVFADERGDEANSEIISLDLATWIETQLTQDPFADSLYPQPSPDGRWIAFQSNREEDFEIYLVNRGGGQLRALTSNTALDRLPAWTPDSQWVIYSTEVDPNIFDLRRVNIQDGTDERILSNGQYNGHARYSPDGRYIVFTMGDTRLDTTTWDIAILDTREDTVRKLTDNALRDASPVWSPDGQHILYITYNAETESSAIAETDLIGRETRIVFDSLGSDWSAHYSPDGQYIVFTSNVTGDDQLYLMTVDGQTVQQITTDGGYYASWIP